MARPIDSVGQGGANETNTKIERLKSQKVSDDRTLEGHQQRVEKLDRELRKSRDTIHQQTRENEELLRENRALGTKLDGKDAEAFRLKRALFNPFSLSRVLMSL